MTEPHPTASTSSGPAGSLLAVPGSLTALGDLAAGMCVDGVCAVPDTDAVPDTAPDAEPAGD